MGRGLQPAVPEPGPSNRRSAGVLWASAHKPKPGLFLPQCHRGIGAGRAAGREITRG